MGRLTRDLPVTTVLVGDDGSVETDTRGDSIIVEEPLEIRVDGRTLTTTMRTPGNDVELAHGFLHGEGLITAAEHIATARYCAGATGPDGCNTYNVLDLATRRLPRPIEARDLRLTTMTSACGVCGSTSIEQILRRLPHAPESIPLDPRVIVRLPEQLRGRQKLFRRTGGVHAAGAFTLGGELVVSFEDIGRHNAADKVVGRLLLDGRLPARDLVLVMSSRASFELVQKAAMAGFAGLVAVSAPSSLAVEMAREARLFLGAFARGSRMNVYAGEIATPGDEAPAAGR